MKTTKIHYVYKITNINPTDERLYYIGVRSTSKSSAELDTTYQSSSKYLKEAIKAIGSNNFKKEILSTWETRKIAVQEEIRLHNKFDVAKNPLFYNKAKQTSTGFDTSGTKQGTLSEATKKKISISKKGKKQKSPSIETRQKISKALKGKPLKTSTIVKMSIHKQGSGRICCLFSSEHKLLKSDITLVEAKEICYALGKSSRDKPVGNNKASKSMLKKVGKEYLIGAYIL